MTTFPAAAGARNAAAVQTIPEGDAGTTDTTVAAAARTERRQRTWRWFLGRPENPDASWLRRLPLTLPATKDIREHPLYGGAISRFFWRINNYRLTRAGRWFLGLTLALGFFGATTLDIQTYIPFLYAVGFWAVALLFLPLTRPRLALRVRHAGRVAAGSTLPVAVAMTQTGRIPGLDLNVLAHKLPLDVDAVEEAGTPVGTLHPEETAQVTLHLKCLRRGVYRLPGWRVESDFPLGVLNAYRAYPETTSLVVTPGYRPLARLAVPTGRRYQPGGVQLAAKVGESFEYFGNREFREGDNIRDIDWRATARMAGTPILREWREEYFLRVAVILDTHVPHPDDPLSVRMPTLGPLLFPPGRRAREAYQQRRDDFERAVSLSAAVSDYMAGQEYIVDLFAAGSDLYHLQSGRGLGTQEQVLDILASVDPSGKDTLQALLPQLEEDLPQLTSVVCVFLDWNETRRAFADRLRSRGCGVKVVVARTGPTTLDPAADPHFGDGGVTVIDAEAFAVGVEEL